MANQVAPTKGNLIATKKSLSLASLGYDLMDRKRNILIREMMEQVENVKMLRDEITKTYAVAYYALQEANSTGFFRDGHRQCFTCRIHHSHRLMGLDGPLGEHICLTFQFPVLVDDFQRTEQVIGRIICIGQSVCTVIDKAIFFRKAVI